MQTTLYPETIKSLDKVQHLTKEQMFSKMFMEQTGYTSFDYALPQQWLNDFTGFCKENHTQVTYDLIRSTCVWGYGTGVQGPVTACYEVMAAYWMWNCANNHGSFKPQAARDAENKVLVEELMGEIAHLTQRLRFLNK